MTFYLDITFKTYIKEIMYHVCNVDKDLFPTLYLANKNIGSKLYFAFPYVLLH